MASDQSACYHCMASLCGKRYATEEDNAYCVKCYDSLFANICEECKKPIECDFKVSVDLFQKQNCSSVIPSFVEIVHIGIIGAHVLPCLQCPSRFSPSQCTNAWKIFLRAISWMFLETFLQLGRLRWSWGWDHRHVQLNAERTLYRTHSQTPLAQLGPSNT